MAKKEINKSVSRGLNILRFGYFCNNLMFVIPVIVLVYTQKGITVGDFFLIQGIFRLAVFLIVAKFLLDECGILTTLGFTFIMLIPLVWSLKKVSKFLYQK